MDTLDRVLLVLMISGLALFVVFSWSSQEALLKQIERNTAPTIVAETDSAVTEASGGLVNRSEFLTWRDALEIMNEGIDSRRKRFAEAIASTSAPAIEELTATIAALEKRIAPMEKVLVVLWRERQAAMTPAKVEEPKVEGPVGAPKSEVVEEPSQ